MCVCVRTSHTCAAMPMFMAGYLEEEAVKTYSSLLAAIDRGEVWKDKPAPDMAKQVGTQGRKSRL